MQDDGVAATPPGHSDEPASGLAAIAGSVPNAVEITDLKGFLGALGEMLAPVFDEQRDTWEREGPAATAAFEATGAALNGIGGNCPVQAYGTVDGQAFYFRARGDEWQFHIAPTDAEIFDNDIFYIERDYGEGFDAGWMPEHEALGFIVQAIGEFRAQGIEARQGGDGTAPSRSDESPVAKGHAPKPPAERDHD